MKWTMIALGLIGTVTYAVIFLAQAQHENRRARAEAADVPVGIEVVDREIQDIPEFDADVARTPSTPQPVAFADTVQPPAKEPARPQWSGTAWQAGVEAFEAGDFELARTALEAAVSEQENSPYRHYLLGLTYRRLGEGELAVSELARSLELAPGQVRALVHLGRAYLDVDEPARSREVIDEALELDLEFADAWQVLGRIELAEGHLEEAAAAFAKAADKDPQHAWAWNNIGYARIQQERFAEAVEPLRRALATGREEAVFYNNLGVALERTGRSELALTAFARATLLGHGPAETSLERMESIFVARGQAVPDFDEIESIDAVEMASLVAAITEELAVRAQPFDDPIREEAFEGEELGVLSGYPERR